MKNRGMLIRGVLGALIIAIALPTLRIAAADSPDARELDRFFDRDELKIATPDARLHNFKIWVAADDARRQRGLMFVKQLDADAGMFIVYGAPQPVGIWMKNCFIPLDLLFVDATGRVVRVYPNAQPGSEKTISSPSDVLAVLELNGGTAKRLHIAVGAQVMHPVFERPAQNAAR